MRSLIQLKIYRLKTPQVHIKSHEIHAAALDPVPEWIKTNYFIKVIKCTQLQYDYRGIKDDSRYHNFTAFYNKTNENYRMLIEQKIVKPVRIFKRKINHMDHGNNGNNGGRGGLSRG